MTSRTQANAEQLAAAFDSHAVPFDRLGEELERRLAEASGKVHVDRVDWMYSGPSDGASGTVEEKEAFLLETMVVERLGEIKVVHARFGFDDAAFRTMGRQADIQALRDLEGHRRYAGDVADYVFYGCSTFSSLYRLCCVFDSS